MTGTTAAIVALRTVLDGVLGAAGFEWGDPVVDGATVTVLYEALPADLAARVPHVAPHLGDPAGWCVDLWITYDVATRTITTATMEGQPVAELLQGRGHAAAAAAVERAAGFEAQVAAYAAAFEELLRP